MSESWGDWLLRTAQAARKFAEALDGSPLGDKSSAEEERRETSDEGIRDVRLSLALLLGVDGALDLEIVDLVEQVRKRFHDYANKARRAREQRQELARIMGKSFEMKMEDLLEQVRTRLSAAGVFQTQMEHHRKELACVLGVNEHTPLADMASIARTKIKVREGQSPAKFNLARTLGASSDLSLDTLVEQVHARLTGLNTQVESLTHQVDRLEEGRRELAKAIDTDPSWSLTSLVAIVRSNRRVWEEDRKAAGRSTSAPNPNDQRLLDALNELSDAQISGSLNRIRVAEIKLARVKNDHRAWYLGMKGVD